MHTRIRLLAPLVVAGFPALAFAHPDHAHAAVATFSAGLAHPLTGIDHLIAAFALALGIAALSRWTVGRSGRIAVVAAGLAAAHTAAHALVPPVSAGFAAGVAATTFAIYGAALGVGLLVARRVARPAQAR